MHNLMFVTPICHKCFIAFTKNFQQICNQLTCNAVLLEYIGKENCLNQNNTVLLVQQAVTIGKLLTTISAKQIKPIFIKVFILLGLLSPLIMNEIEISAYISCVFEIQNSNNIFTSFQMCGKTKTKVITLSNHKGRKTFQPKQSKQ